MSGVDPVDLKRALLVPSAVFESPAAVVTTEGLTREQRIEILRRWEFDAREMQVAEEEGMRGEEGLLLERVRAALRALGAEADADGQRGPTEHGG